MRSIDLALYADVLAGEAASLAAIVPFAVERLEELGLLSTRGDPEALAALTRAAA